MSWMVTRGWVALHSELVQTLTAFVVCIFGICVILLLLSLSLSVGVCVWETEREMKKCCWFPVLVISVWLRAIMRCRTFLWKLALSLELLKNIFSLDYPFMILMVICPWEICGAKRTFLWTVMLSHGEGQFVTPFLALLCLLSMVWVSTNYHKLIIDT